MRAEAPVEETITVPPDLPRPEVDASVRQQSGTGTGLLRRRACTSPVDGPGEELG
jgi:hypothetical protein